MSRLGPEPEHVRLNVTERGRWLQILACELRWDFVSRKAVAALTDVLTEGTREGPWCACPEHVEALKLTFSLLWRDDE